MPRPYRRNLQQPIARAAAEIIGNAGPEHATIRAIAARSGVSKGVVEHHFAGKNDILRKTLAWANERMIERERRRTAGLHGLAAARERLRTIIPLTPDAVKDWKMRIHFWSMALANPREDMDTSAGLAGARERFREDLKQAVASGEVPSSVDPLQAANLLLHLAGGVAWNMFVDPAYYNRRYRERIIDRTIEALRRGVI